MDRSQISYFFIVGLLFVIIFSFAAFYLMRDKAVSGDQEAKRAINFDDLGNELERYINDCVTSSVRDSIQDTGLGEESKQEYVSLVGSKIKLCVDPVIIEIKEKGYIVSEDPVKIDVGINPETVIVDINYNLLVQKGDQKISFSRFHYTFDRTIYTYVSGGIAEKEITLISPDGKATLRIPEGVRMTDEEGKPVENIGIKLLDRHFDGLENRYAVGQVIYDNLPDGTRFSEPVEFSVEFRDRDIPENYTSGNIRIAFWYNETGIWYAENTAIIGNKAVANITHFTKRGNMVGNPNVEVFHIFEQRYNPTGASTTTTSNKDLSKCWLIGGGQNSKEGTASPQKGVPDSLFTGTADCSKLDEIRDFREKLICLKDKYTTTIKYGYYENGVFRDLEPSEETPAKGGNMKYGVDENNDPYFILKDYGCFYGKTCTSCNDPNSLSGKDACIGAALCSQYQEKIPKKVTDYTNSKLCMPDLSEPIDEASETIPCCAKTLSEIENMEKKFTNRRFGMFNWQAAGGIVVGDPYTNVLAFEPNGNAVISIDFFGILPDTYDIPLPVFVVLWPSKEFLGSDSLNIGAAKVLKYSIENKNSDLFFTQLNTLLEDKGKYHFYCYENDRGNYIMPEQEVLEPGTAMYDFFKKKMGFTGTPKIVAYGIKDLEIILKSDMAKNSLHTGCDSNWFFWGNGYHFNTPVELQTKGVMSINPQLIQNSPC